MSDVPPPIPIDARRQARSLFWRGWGVKQIAAELSLARTTVQSWKDREKWDDAPSILKMEDSTETRFNILVHKEEKTGRDFKEIDLLGRQIERFARVRRYNAPGGHEGDLNDKVGNRNASPKKKPKKNEIGTEAALKLHIAFAAGLFRYQESWRDSTSLRTRFLIKSRQIGATWYFAREALIRGIETGNNQIFISASRAQANIFRQYIIEFVFATTGIKLSGDPLVIDRGIGEDGSPLEPFTMYFLGTNYRTAQGYHGDVYVDECFWIYGFEQIYKVASAMATQKRYRKTLFSTPSTIAHEAYPLWTGERYNRRRAKEDRVRIDTAHEVLRRGVGGGDGIWRHMVTLEDAIAGGCDLIDLEEIRQEYSPDEFDNLFGCLFVDDSQSSFPMSLIRPCMVDSWEVWKDWQPYAIRPFGNGEAWIGYDPAGEGQDGDDAGCVVVAPPASKKGKFRVLEKVRFKGKDFEQQDAELRKLAKKYRVTEIAIDKRGVGAAVFQLVRKWHPTVRGIDYSPVVKGQMVLKAKNVFSNRRIEFDAGWIDLAMALMSIHPELTKGGKHLTYVARRSAETGHGDLAWALLHALFCEPLDANEGSNQSSVEIFG